MHTPTITPHAVKELIDDGDLATLTRLMRDLPPTEIASIGNHLPRKQASIAFRMLPKSTALEVFEHLSPRVQQGLIDELGTTEVGEYFAGLDPDDRAELLDELPTPIAHELVATLRRDEREATGVVLGFPRGSVGRRMSPEIVHAVVDDTAESVLNQVKAVGDRVETIYTIPVTEPDRELAGVVSLRDLLLADPGTTMTELMRSPVSARADDDAEQTAQRCVERGILATPVVDSDNKVVGVLTLDDAIEVIEQARDEDQARAGASEPLEEPYLLASVWRITRSRVVWLFVLAVSAILTVNVLEIFEATLDEMVALALFIPLLTGIGGNTGSQAAVTVTRALAVDDVRTRDVVRVVSKEFRVGLTLGACLGVVGFAVASLAYDTGIGTVIGLTIVAICTMAATVGGLMPLAAKSIHVDPAVFSTPFISTFCDATGLIIYFTIAKAVLNI
ncbi:magnesium transporter [Gordonia otitidis]|uniref:magnesium transporter n=1 Tax=Gordonia otitidis TaxID=249058 RepID=UPI00235719CA|nr:magnesium transporter [Gordonia otitidis]